MLSSVDGNNKKLESKMVKYRDLLPVLVKENFEPFVFLNPEIIPNGYAKGMIDVKKIFGPRTLVRETVYLRLKRAQKSLKQFDNNLTLYVTYGYRSLERQTSRFLWQLGKQGKVFFEDPVDLYEEAHRNVAVPTVAGHPTGGAVDVVIKDKLNGKVLDFGSPQYDYSTKKTYVFTDQISEKQKANRILLRKVLLDAEFAPFDGEWWHFSYGDKEWAHFYKKKYAIYSQIPSNKIRLK